MVNYHKTKKIFLLQTMLLLVPLPLLSQPSIYLLGGTLTIGVSTLPFLARFNPHALKRSVLSFGYYTLLKYTAFSVLLMMVAQQLSWMPLLTGVIAAQTCYILACILGDHLWH